MQFTLTEWLAVYAAGLSTVLAIVRLAEFVRDWRKEKRKVIVTCDFGVYSSRSPSHSTTFGGQVLGMDTVDVRATNDGYRQVQINQVGFRLKSGGLINTHKAYQNDLPVTLTDGEGTTVKFDYHAVKKGPPLRSAYVQDAHGNVYEGKLPEELTWNE